MPPLIPFPALLFEERKMLVIADLHIGWEVTLGQQGIHIPSQVDRLLSKTLAALEASKAEELLVLGDVKHTIAKAEYEEWRDIPYFFEKILKKINSISIVPGNHDANLEALLPEKVIIHPSTGISIDNVTFVHGHILPSPEIVQKSKQIVMGHMHPKIMLRDSLGVKTILQIWINMTCNIEKLIEALQKRYKLEIDLPFILKCTILPSFNDLLGGRAVNLEEKGTQYMGPLMRSAVFNFKEAEIFLLDGTYLGNIEQLKITD